MVDDSDSTPAADLALDTAPPARTARPRALWGVLAVIAVVTGAVVAISGGGDDGPPRLPVALGSSGGAEGTRAAADMSLAAWITYIAGEELPLLGGEGPVYRLEGAVDPAAVRRLAGALGMTGEPRHEDRFWHLEADGAVLEVYEDGGGTWWYSTQQGSGGVVSITGSSECEPGPATDCAPVDIPAPTDSGECPPEADCLEPARPEPAPQPPVDLPSKAEARTIALDLLGATGMDLTDAEVRVEGPYDSWYVTVEPRVDGLLASGWAASVSVGSNGAVTNASGVLGSPELVGDYPLIDSRRAAVDRLNDQQGGFGGGPVPLGTAGGGATGSAGDARAADDATAREDAVTTHLGQCKVQPNGSEICEAIGTPIDPPVQCQTIAIEPGTDPGTAPTDGAPDEAVEQSAIGCEPCHESAPPPVLPNDAVTDATAVPAPAPEPGCYAPYPHPVPEPEPVDVVLTGAERALMLVPAFDGSGDAYLLPGYRLSNADGVIVEVVAVADESLTQPDESPDTTVPFQESHPPSSLDPGTEPELGVGYYVEVAVQHCPEIIFAERRWVPRDVFDPTGWSTPTEGGTFTLTTPDEGEFVGDHEGTKRARFVAHGPADEPVNCA